MITNPILQNVLLPISQQILKDTTRDINGFSVSLTQLIGLFKVAVCHGLWLAKKQYLTDYLMKKV